MDEVSIEEADTAGGSIEVFVSRDKAVTRLVLGDRELDPVGCRVIVNPYIREPLVSDKLIDSLGIIVLSFSRGLWRHRSDPEGVVRESYSR